MTEYPYPCCRCGFCCLSETCPAVRELLGIGKHDPCPELSFDGDVATCRIALAIPEMVGAGAGCCIKARAIKGGVTYDFAALPLNLKRSIAQARRST